MRYSHSFGSSERTLVTRFCQALRQSESCKHLNAADAGRSGDLLYDAKEPIDPAEMEPASVAEREPPAARRRVSEEVVHLVVRAAVGGGHPYQPSAPARVEAPVAVGGRASRGDGGFSSNSALL